MDNSVLIAWLSFGGVLLTALGIYAGARYTARVSAKAQKDQIALAAKGQVDQSSLERSKVDAAAYTSAREIWGDLIDDLRSQIAGQREELRILRERIDSLELSRNADRNAIRVIGDYALALLRIVQDANIPHPAPPPGLTDRT